MGGKGENGVELWTGETLIKLLDALEFLEGEHAPNVLFMPDVIRDGIIIVPPTKDLSHDIAPEGEKSRLREYVVFKKGGGHAFIGAYAAAVQRGKTDARIAIAAKIFDMDRAELVDWYMSKNPQELGANPIDTSLVFQQPGAQSSLNIVIEQRGATPIITGEQPSLKLTELGGEEHSALINAMRAADVVAALSVKAPSFEETVRLAINGDLEISELFSDCTSGDNMETNYRILDLLRLRNSNSQSPITLLSINSDEVLLYAALLELEYRGERQAVIEKFTTDRVLQEFRDRNGLEAARLLNEKLGIPLLYHSSEGTIIVDSEHGRQTRLIPSVNLERSPDNFVGAGDTLCGGMALALAVRRKLDDPAVHAPEELRLSLEECLLIANLVTCYRLDRIAQLSQEGKDIEWHTSVGTAAQLLDWAKDVTFNRVSEVPAKDVAKVIAVDLAEVIGGTVADIVRSGFDGKLVGSHLDAALSASSRKKRGSKKFSLDELEHDVSLFMFDYPHLSWFRVSFLNGFGHIPLSEDDCYQLAHRVIQHHILSHPLNGKRDAEPVGIILRKLGQTAADVLAKYIGSSSKPKDIRNLIKVAQTVGKSFLDQAHDILVESRLTVMLYPWRHQSLDNLLRALGEVGNEETARILAQSVPTRRLLVPPPAEAPVLSALRAISKIASRTKLADTTVAQALYEAYETHITAHGFGYMLGLMEVIDDYDPSVFPSAAHSTYEIMKQNITEAGLQFEPQEPPWQAVEVEDGSDIFACQPPDESYVRMLARQVVEEKSTDHLSERDHRDFREKLAVLQKVQAGFMRLHPKIKKMLEDREKTPPKQRR